MIRGSIMGDLVPYVSNEWDSQKSTYSAGTGVSEYTLSLITYWT